MGEVDGEMDDGADIRNHSARPYGGGSDRNHVAVAEAKVTWLPSGAQGDD